MEADTTKKELLDEKDLEIASLRNRLSVANVLIQMLDERLREALSLPNISPVEEFQREVEEIAANAENRS